MAFTALASGGVGKTTLTLGLALTVARAHACRGDRRAGARRPRLPGGVGHGRLPADPPDAYTLATQGGDPAGWQQGRTELTVVPMDGRQGALLTGEGCAALLARLRASHALVVVDAVQPHPLWPAVDAAVRCHFRGRGG